MPEENPFDFATTEADYAPPARPRYRRRKDPIVGWLMLLVMLASLPLVCVPALAAVVFAVGWIGGVVWAAADTAGDPSAAVWIILVLLGGPVGLLAYLVQRQP